MSQKVMPTGTRVPTFDTLAERLWWSRETARITQESLAAQLGIHKRTVQNYERGTQAPKLSRLVLWANACDVDAGWLAGNAFGDAPFITVGSAPDNRRSRSCAGVTGSLAA